MIVPADLRALGVSPCGCGAVYKRTSRPWLCGPGCVPSSEGRPASAIAGRSRVAGGGAAALPREGSTPSPRPSKPSAGKAAEDALAERAAREQALLDGFERDDEGAQEAVRRAVEGT